MLKIEFGKQDIWKNQNIVFSKFSNLSVLVEFAWLPEYKVQLYVHMLDVHIIENWQPITL